VGLLSEGLLKDAVQVSIAAPPDFSLEIPSELKSRISSFSIPLTARPHPLKDFQAAQLVARYASEQDLIHGHGLRGAWIAALAARFSGKPMVFTAHNLAPENPGTLTRVLFNFVVKQASKAICVSQAVADSLLPYGVGVSQAVVIPNGIDLSQFDLAASQRPDDPLTQRPSVVSIGRLSPEKGFDILIAAAPLVLEQIPGAQFILIGDGQERQKLELLARGLGENVVESLRSTDVVAIPSRLEGQGIVALEAMAAWKPVVASAVGGLVETVQDGVTGLLVPPENPRVLAASIVELLQDEGIRQRMGIVGRKLVEEKYTAYSMVRNTLTVYRAAIAGNPT
jgi:glycosyltransferase involved in cell wall biosynthesis